MKITFVGHAVLLVEAGGVKIISDPWWIGPCFGVQWWQWPRPQLQAIDGLMPDFIYVSHGHNDHLHPGTLRRLPKTARVLVSEESGIAEAIERLGFCVTRLASGIPTRLSPEVTAEIIDTCNGDTMLVVADGHEVLVNANDALHAAPRLVQDRVIADLGQRHPAIDYLFLGYGTASAFPNCFFVPGKDNAASAARRQAHFNAAWASLVARIAPRFAFPFAAGIVLLDEALMWSNEPVHNAERPTSRFRREYPTSPIGVCDIAPGFTIVDGRIADEILFRPVSVDQLRHDMAAEIGKANEVATPDARQIVDLARLIEANIAHCRSFLAECDFDYRVLIRLKRAATAIEIAKNRDRISCQIVGEPADPDRYDAVFTTRFAYLRRALTTPFGYEVISVGSGGIWQYRDSAAAHRNIHREIAEIIKQVQAPPRSRFGDQPRWLYRLKSMVKRLRGREIDLYDLSEWTIGLSPREPRRAGGRSRGGGRRS